MTVWDGAGWHCRAQRAPSPYHDERPVRSVVDLLVVHAISLPPEGFGSGDVQRFFMGTLDFNSYPYYDALRGLQVSAHFFIERDGTLWQHVGVFQRAWHAGASEWQGRPACNDYSIGVELEGSESTTFMPTQYQRLAILAKELQSLFPGMDPERMVGHSDIAPGRKWDPGPGFSWSYLAEVSKNGRNAASTKA